MVKDSSTNKIPAMHNFQIHDRYKLDILRNILQKIGDELMHFSICYGFYKLAYQMKFKHVKHTWKWREKAKNDEYLNNAGAGNRTRSNFKWARHMKRTRFAKTLACINLDGSNRRYFQKTDANLQNAWIFIFFMMKKMNSEEHSSPISRFSRNQQKAYHSKDLAMVNTNQAIINPKT